MIDDSSGLPLVVDLGSVKVFDPEEVKQVSKGKDTPSAAKIKSELRNQDF